MKEYEYQYKYRLISEPGTLSEFKKLTSSEDAYQFLNARYKDLDTFVETFSILGLNQAHNPVIFKAVSTGGIAATLIDIKVIAKYLLDSLCVAYIICHNHPSGNLTPSEADRHQTRKIKEAMNLFDIKMLDHLILTEESYYSFADNADL